MTILIKAARLIDGLGHEPVTDAVVLVDGDRIRAIGRGPAEQFGPADQVLEFPEGTLLPGFIDSHIHLTFDPHAYSTQEHVLASSDEVLLGLGREHAAAYLQAGVTTVRDLGARGRLSLDVRDEVARQPLSGPHILAAGPALTAIKGHIWFVGIEAADKAELAAAARQVVAMGVDVVKVVATGGGVTPLTDPSQAQFTADEISGAVEVAHAAGLKVGAHTHSAVGVRNCLDAGMDTIEHCTFITPQGLKSDLELIDRLARVGAHVIPTLSPWYVVRDSDDPNLGFPQWGFSPKRLWPDVLQNLSLLKQAGVRLATGTDSGTWQLTPDKFYDEMFGFMQAGFSAIEVIAAATSVGAGALNIADETGSLQTGKRADLVVVPGDPTRDFSVMARPSLVVKAGQIAVGQPAPQG